jgi:hypothetical protein
LCDDVTCAGEGVAVNNTINMFSGHVYRCTFIVIDYMIDMQHYW